MIDWLAEQVLHSFADCGLDDSYIEEKRRSLSGRDRLEVIRYLNNLDDRVFINLANRLNIDPDALLITARTIRQL